MPSDVTRSKIGDLAVRTEEVLLLLVKDFEDLKEKLEAETGRLWQLFHHIIFISSDKSKIVFQLEQCFKFLGERQRETSDLRDRLEKETTALKDALQNEIKARESDRDNFQAQLEKLENDSRKERNELQNQLDKERNDRINQAKEMDDYFR